ncbi:MAG: helix-turn-helix transcriptional regulator [Tyzzerella sp.]|nr:helix-turn-helix transcriptional regulator [Tyzzerella sp.]
MKLGENIREKRKELKLSQEYIAEQLGVSRQAVSKWETGQTDPTAKNLVELAQLFGITVSELVESGQLAQGNQSEKPAKNAVFRKNMEVMVASFYSGAVIMTGITTNDRGFYIFADVMVLFLAIAMCVNIMRLPEEVRLKMALKELTYCITVYCVMTFLTPVIGNVFSGAIVCILMLLYMKYVRFKEY